MKKTLLIFLFALVLLFQGCSCSTWSSFWGNDPDVECASHWDWKKAETAKPAAVPCPKPTSPCAPAPVAKVAQSYPSSDMPGNVVRLEKMVPEEVRVNEPFDYRMKVTNLTNTEIQDVVVMDVWPANLKVKSSDPKISAIEKGTAHWNIGALGPKEAKIINISAIAQGTGALSTCAEVTYYRPTCAQINIIEPKIQLAKYAPAETLKCDRIPVRYVIKNTGTGAACDIKISDKLQDGLMASSGKGNIMFAVDSLAPGQTREFKAMLDASKSGVFASKAAATSSTAGSVESNMPQTMVKEPKLAIKGTCPSDRYIGKQLSYDIVVSNSGNGIAKNTVVEASVPADVEFKGASAGGTFSKSSPGKVKWNVGSLNPNQSKTLFMQLYTNKAGAVVTNTKANAYCAQPVTSTCKTMISGIPAILLEVVDVSDPIQVGESETYIITVTNQGSAPDTNIQITCMLEGNMQYVSSSGPTSASVVGSTIKLAPLSSLAPKAQAKWHIKVKGTDAADSRFKVMMNTGQLSRPVEETEATHFYK